MGVAGLGCPWAARALLPLLLPLLLTAAVPPGRGGAAGPPEGECPAAGAHLARRAGRAPGRGPVPLTGAPGASGAGARLLSSVWPPFPWGRTRRPGRGAATARARGPGPECAARPRTRG